MVFSARSSEASEIGNTAVRFDHHTLTIVEGCGRKVRAPHRVTAEGVGGVARHDVNFFRLDRCLAFAGFQRTEADLAGIDNQTDLSSGARLGKQPGTSKRLIQRTNTQGRIVEQSFEPTHDTAFGGLAGNTKRDVGEVNRLGEQNTGHQGG